MKHVSDQEADRLDTLDEYELLDTPAEPTFDAIVADAASRTAAPIAMVSLIDADRQWFKAKLGIDNDETPIEGSLCRVAIETDDLLVVPDALADARFADSQFVTSEPRIRFYAGMPLTVANGARLGTLCVIDTSPREGLSAEEDEALRVLARRTVAAMELRRGLPIPLAPDAARDLCLAQAGRLLDLASAALERTGASAALAQLEGVITAVDDLRAPNVDGAADTAPARRGAAREPTAALA